MRLCTACKYLFIIALAAIVFACKPEPQQEVWYGEESLQQLANNFKEPPIYYRPNVWWHWLGSNFSKEGITKDLEAMKEAGIGGATIFNIASSVQNTHAPIDNNPWPEQTFRSEAYWDAFKHTMAEAKRLGLTIGLHGTPGYATTGGPWIPQERGMQTLVFSKTPITGNRLVEINLQKPELPVYHGYSNVDTNDDVVDSFGQNATSKRATYYKDVAVMAIPEKNNPTAAEIMDISQFMDTTGLLKWQAPKGNWTVCRIGHAPTMAHPHPLPDDIIGKSLEVDKMSREDNIFHWQKMLDPLKEHIGEYFGTTFTYIWVDSYESGDQNWTPTFREEFIRLKNYDPLPFISLQQYSKQDSEENKKFQNDYDEVIGRLFVDNGWKTSAEMLHQYGLKMYWEPYFGQFNKFHSRECMSIPDVPVGEFWTGGNGDIWQTITNGAKEFNKKIVAAEAFTGSPENSKYTEDPAFLKHAADGGYLSGVNLYFLHHWVQQPFDERYQPGMGMGWWGTHFSRYQTWFKPGKAFFAYLARCQMLLQQGVYVSNNGNVLQRSAPHAEIFFVANREQKAVSKTFRFPVKDRIPELWDAYHGTISQTDEWKATGDTMEVNLKLEPDESVFVIFPKETTCSYAKLRLPAVKLINEKVIGEVSGPWNITFQPKTEKTFKREFSELTDFSQHPDTAVKYFAGTASYEKTIHIKPEDLDKNIQIVLDLGKLEDIAELEVNGKDVGVLWHPPYKAEISKWLKKGDNKITIHVTNNWANRLIGDEQYPADFEWGADRGNQGRAMKAFPDWFIQNQPRPSQGRKAFTIWYYYHPDSPLQPAGLFGPVRIIKLEVLKT